MIKLKALDFQIIIYDTHKQYQSHQTNWNKINHWFTLCLGGVCSEGLESPPGILSRMSEGLWGYKALTLVAGPTRGWGTQGCTEMGSTATCLICDTRALTQTRLNNICFEKEVQCTPAESSGWALSRFPVLLLPGCLPWGRSQVWSDGCEQRLEPMPEST